MSLPMEVRQCVAGTSVGGLRAFEVLTHWSCHKGVSTAMGGLHLPDNLDLNSFLARFCF